jgi:hypothetical protein
MLLSASRTSARLFIEFADLMYIHGHGTPGYCSHERLGHHQGVSTQPHYNTALLSKLRYASSNEASGALPKASNLLPLPRSKGSHPIRAKITGIASNPGPKPFPIPHDHLLRTLKSEAEKVSAGTWNAVSRLRVLFPRRPGADYLNWPRRKLQIPYRYSQESDSTY